MLQPAMSQQPGDGRAIAHGSPHGPDGQALALPGGSRLLWGNGDPSEEACSALYDTYWIVPESSREHIFIVNFYLTPKIRSFHPM